MNKRLPGVFVFVFTASSGGAFILNQLVTAHVQAEAPPSRPTTEIFVAARNLEPGSFVRDSDLRIEKYLTAPTGVISKKEEIVGRSVVNPVHEDQPFFELALAPQGAGRGFAATIPKGMRAFEVRLNEVAGSAGFATAGMRVDVLASGPTFGTSKTGSRTLLQNVEVLSAGRDYEKLVQVVNLLVTPAQAEIMNLAADRRIQLVLRNPSDQEVVQTPGASEENVLSPGAVRQAGVRRLAAAEPTLPAPPTATPPAQPHSVVVELFAGEQRSQTIVQNPGPEPPK